MMTFPDELNFCNEIQYLLNLLDQQSNIWRYIPNGCVEMITIHEFGIRLRYILFCPMDKQKEKFIEEFPSVDHHEILALFKTSDWDFSAEQLKETEIRHCKFLENFKTLFEEAHQSVNIIVKSKIPETQTPPPMSLSTLFSSFVTRFCGDKETCGRL